MVERKDINNFNLKVYTPSGLLLDETVKEVIFPGYDNGEVGVYANHCEYTGIVGNGVLKYTPANSNTSKMIEVTGGFSSVNDGSLIILADSVASLQNAA